MLLKENRLYALLSVTDADSILFIYFVPHLFFFHFNSCG